MGKVEKEEGCGRLKRASFFQMRKPKPVSQLGARPPRSFHMGPTASEFRTQAQTPSQEPLCPGPLPIKDNKGSLLHGWFIALNGKGCARQQRLEPKASPGRWREAVVSPASTTDVCTWGQRFSWLCRRTIAGAPYILVVGSESLK